MFKPIKVIVCCDKNNGIGIDNNLPWKINKEMNIFKEKTIGNNNNCVIMGSNTYYSIPKKYRPLIKRKNCVITRSSKHELDVQNVYINNLDIALEEFLSKTNYDEYWIIGGELIYKTIMEKYVNSIEEIHISIINKEFGCNKFFPKINNNLFKISDYTHYKDDDFTHYVYKNINHHNKDYP